MLSDEHRSPGRWATTRPFFIMPQKGSSIQGYDAKQERRIYFWIRLLLTADRMLGWWRIIRRKRRDNLLTFGEGVHYFFDERSGMMINLGKIERQVDRTVVRNSLPDQLKSRLDPAVRQYMSFQVIVPATNTGDSTNRNPMWVMSNFNRHAAEIYGGRVDFDSLELQDDLDEDLARIIFNRLEIQFPESAISEKPRVSVFPARFPPKRPR